MSYRVEGLLPQLDAAKTCAKETLARYEAKAPQFFATFTDVQRELIADWMAETFLCGIRDGATRLLANITSDVQSDEQQNLHK